MDSTLKLIGFVVVSLYTSLCMGNPHGSSDSTDPFNFDFKGNSFRNTHKTDYCLLARLNGSIIISYKPNNIIKEIFIPKNASNENSICDYNFESILSLTFEGVTYKLHFKRNDVPTSETQANYCENCNEGSWSLYHIKLTIENTSTIFPLAPAANIHAIAGNDMLNDEAGGFKEGISLQRGYRCNDKVLYAKLEIERAVKLLDVDMSEDDWSVAVHFYDIRVQPFLVIDRKIKDPVLCTDFTVFIVLIITLPIVYFTIFVTVYRVKERYGCPPDLKKKQEKDEFEEKYLVKAEEIPSDPHHPAIAVHPSIRLTAPEKTSKPVI